MEKSLELNASSSSPLTRCRRPWERKTIIKCYALHEIMKALYPEMKFYSEPIFNSDAFIQLVFLHNI